MRALDCCGEHGRATATLLSALPGNGGLDMSAPEPPPARSPNRIALAGVWREGGHVSVVVTKLANGQIEFTPQLSGARAFAVDEDDLIRALLRWVLR